MKLNLVGTIVGTHGIKGEVKVKSDTSFARFTVGNTLYLKQGNNTKEIVINSHRVHKNMDLITFNNLKNINDVLEYVGSEIYVDVSDLDELEDDEYYYDDLIGLIAYTEEGKELGVIQDINEVPQGIILVLEKPDQTTALIPFVEEFIAEVNIEENKIIITPIEGLLWE